MDYRAEAAVTAQELEQAVERAVLRAIQSVKESESDDRLLETVEAAALLGVSAATLPTWRSRGRGPAFVKVGGSIRYRRGDLLRYRESQTRTRTIRRKRKPKESAPDPQNAPKHTLADNAGRTG